MSFRSSYVIAAALSIAGCSKQDPAEQGAPTEDRPAAKTARPTKRDQPERPAPTKAELIGSSRVVNLVVVEGKPATVDIWGRRSFTHGPIQLAKGLAFGKVSEWYGVPKGMATVLLPAGSDKDAKEMSSLGTAREPDEQVTNIVFFERGKPVAINKSYQPGAKRNQFEKPSAGHGLVYLWAMPLSSHQNTLAPRYGGRSFHVGNGDASGRCAKQLVEDKGLTPSILGGTQPTQHELAPGTHTFTFHKWPAGSGMKDKQCSSDKLFDVTVDVAEGQGTMVVLYTRDGTSIETVQFPMWR